MVAVTIKIAASNVATKIMMRFREIGFVKNSGRKLLVKGFIKATF